MRSIHIQAGNYDVLVGGGLLRQAGERLRSLGRKGKAFIVSDDTVYALYGQPLASALEAAGFQTAHYIFPHGEQHKTMSTLSCVLEAMAASDMTRADFAVALGGGVVGDVTGFAAAVYMRGIPFVQIPTTLLSAVDASVGGKTAVDLSRGKNLAGAFHQPCLVLCDTDILRALPPSLTAEGSAEMIKCGVLADPDLFDSMENGAWRRDLESAVSACVAIKARLVDEDPFDNGARQLLNLGHTFGHAVEALSLFTISHGQAVAAGTVMAFRAAGLDPAPMLRAAKACGLMTESPYSWQELSQAALHDKKRRGGKITLVLPERIGKCALKTIPVEELPDYFRRGTGAAL